MRFSRLFAIAFLACLLPMRLAWAAAPAPTCDCYCASAKGAVKLDGPLADAAACSNACDAKGYIKPIVCAKNAAEVPGNSPSCFGDAKSCATNCAGPVGANQPATGAYFDTKYQPPECPKDFHYCYCTGVSYSLEIPINGTTSVKDVGDYVQTVYHYLLGFAMIVAIVMVMIGGLQYLLAAGGASSTKEGKAKINNAVIGLILLFAAALILQTVNPRLLTLQPPRLPAIKRIQMIGSGQDCSSLKLAGATLADKPSQGYVCGSKDVVVKGPGGVAVPDGTSCTYTTCPAGQGCFVSGDSGKCLTCSAVAASNNLGVTPSSSVCSSLTLRKDTDPPYVGAPYCFWSQDPSLMLGFNTQTFGAAASLALGVSGTFVAGPVGGAAAALAGLKATGATDLIDGTCSEVRITCPIANCEAYGGIAAVNDKTDSSFSHLGPGWGDLDLQKLCAANPCGLGGGCLYDAAKNNCITPIKGQGATGDHCSADIQCNSGICNQGGLYSQCTAPGGDAEGTKCKRAKDCKSGSCTGGGTFTDGTCGAVAVQCSTNSCVRDSDCCSNVPLCDKGGNNAICVAFGFGPPGFGCTRPAECASNICTGNKCQ